MSGGFGQPLIELEVSGLICSLLFRIVRCTPKDQLMILWGLQLVLLEFSYPVWTQQRRGCASCSRRVLCTGSDSGGRLGLGRQIRSKLAISKQGLKTRRLNYLLVEVRFIRID